MSFNQSLPEYLNSIYSEMVYALRAHERDDGRQHSDCPFCHKPAKKGHNHFSFYHTNENEHGFYCWHCTENGGLTKLYKYLKSMGLVDTHGPVTTIQRPVHKPKPKPPPQWKSHIDLLQAEFTKDIDKVARLWTSYKPLERTYIEKYGLGVGKLPFRSKNHEFERLIVPIIAGGKIIGFRGRAFLPDDKAPKWLSATGTSASLWNMDSIGISKTIMVCENHVDALLVAQLTDEKITAVAGTAGVGTWHDDWTRLIVNANPNKVLVATDNDLAGQATGQALLQLSAKIKPGQKVHLWGLRLHHRLLSAGLPVELFRYPDATTGYDIGMLVNEFPEYLKRYLTTP